MRVVLDSNILFSALITRHGVPGKIYQAWREKRFTVVTCPEQLAEIRRASRYPGIATRIRRPVLGRLIRDLGGATVVTEFAPLPESVRLNDPQDLFLIRMALSSGADYLVTGDKRSGLLEVRVRGLRVVSATEFRARVLGVT